MVSLKASGSDISLACFIHVYCLASYLHATRHLKLLFSSHAVGVSVFTLSVELLTTVGEVIGLTPFHQSGGPALFQARPLPMTNLAWLKLHVH